MSGIVIHASQFTQGGPSRTGGRYCGYEGPSSGQRLGVAHHRHAECGSSPARSSGRFCFPRQRDGGDRRIGPGHLPAPDFSRSLKASGSLISSRIKLPGDLRENAVSDRSDSFKLSCVSRFHGRNRSIGVVGNVRKEIGEIQNA